MSRNTIENCKNIAKARGGECLSNKYVNSKTKLKWNWFQTVKPNSQLWDKKKLKEMNIL